MAYVSTAAELYRLDGEDPGPVPAARVEAEATAAGVSFTTLRAAKKRLRVESRRVTRDGKAVWEWVWPEGELPELGPV